MRTMKGVANACNAQLHDRAIDDQEQCAVQQLAVKAVFPRQMLQPQRLMHKPCKQRLHRCIAQMKLR